jgi:hypothetical protein
MIRVARFIRRGVPEPHGKTDNLVSFLFQESRDGGAVHASAHGNGDFHIFSF